MVFFPLPVELGEDGETVITGHVRPGDVIVDEAGDRRQFEKPGAGETPMTGENDPVPGDVQGLADTVILYGFEKDSIIGLLRSEGVVEQTVFVSHLEKSRKKMGQVLFFRLARCGIKKTQHFVDHPVTPSPLPVDNSACGNSPFCPKEPKELF